MSHTTAGTRRSLTGRSFEVDHVFVAVGRGAPEMDRLRATGFEEGPENVHAGQGTACRRLFFENLYLELIWLADPVAADGPTIRRTGLAARAGCEAGASRLGLALRPTETPGVAFPVDTWPYRPPYLPEDRAIPVACSSTVVEEPLLFFMPWGRQWSAPRIPHPNGATRVTDVSLTVRAGGPPSRALQWLRGWAGVRVEAGESELLRVELDRGARGRSLTLAPAAPLEVVW